VIVLSPFIEIWCPSQGSYQSGSGITTVKSP